MATPMSEDFAPDATRMATRVRTLLGDGADGVALFGTTGEGPHFPVAQRQAALEQIVASGKHEELLATSRVYNEILGSQILPDAKKEDAA